MFWGQLVTIKSKEERQCTHCKEAIPLGEKQIGLVSRSRNEMRFTRRLHFDCLIPYLVAEEVVRAEKIAEERHNRPGRPSFGLPDEKQARRKLLTQYVISKRSDLESAYWNPKSGKKIGKIKAKLVEYLQELNSGELGPHYQFKFGPALLERIQAGADPDIPYTQALRADTEDKNLGYQLLSLTAASPKATKEEVGVDFEVELLSCRAELKAMIAERDWPEVKALMRRMGVILKGLPKGFVLPHDPELAPLLMRDTCYSALKYDPNDIKKAAEQGKLAEWYTNVGEKE